MPVTFVYRSHYQNPGCRHVRRFEDVDTVLDWFRSIWSPIPEDTDEDAHDHAKELLGRDVYSFHRLFERIAEHGWPAPATMAELTERLSESIYGGEVLSGPHHVQALTDDDELEMALYFFDDHYAKKRPDRAAFVGLDGWELPDGAADGGFKPSVKAAKAPKLWAGDGTTYWAYLAAYDSGSLSDLPDFALHGRIDGVRLPDLPRYLFAADGNEGLAPELRSLATAVKQAADAATGQEKAFLDAVRANPADGTAWAAFSDWLVERDRPPAARDLLAKALPLFDPRDDKTAEPAKDLVLVRDHVAQACKFAGNWGEPYGDLYYHLVLFDDRWAAAHPDLANGILRFASRWDVL